MASLDFTDPLYFPPYLVCAIASQDVRETRCVISSYMVRSALLSFQRERGPGCFGLPGDPTQACQSCIAVSARTRVPLARLTVPGNRYIRELLHVDGTPPDPVTRCLRLLRKECTASQNGFHRHARVDITSTSRVEARSGLVRRPSTPTMVVVSTRTLHPNLPCASGLLRLVTPRAEVREPLR